jgi:hypothetical protein
MIRGIDVERLFENIQNNKNIKLQLQTIIV